MTTDLKEFRVNFFVLVEKATAIVITSHMSPDDDSIGSVLSTYTILSEKYPDKNIRIVYTGQKSSRHSGFYNFEKIEWVDDIAHHLDGVDTLITLDASNFGRFSKFPEKLLTVPVRIGLDHHASVPDEYTLLLHEKEFSSNAELVYRALLEDGVVSKHVAEHILLGILGDTGNFAFLSPEQGEVLVLTKILIETVGVSIGEFRARYGGIPLRIIPLLQELVKNTTYGEVSGWPPFQYTQIAREVAFQGDYSDEDISAASAIYIGQYLTRVEGYVWGFVITPRSDGGCRMSSRSLPGSVNVRDLHERLGIGSGHDRAAGGAFKEISNPSECINRVLDWMKENTPLL